jgi:hypothetical protein
VALLDDALKVTEGSWSVSLAAPEEFVVGNCMVRVYASPISLAGVEGWVGAWEVYMLPWYRAKKPSHVGQTDVDSSAELALGMAKAIGSAIAACI